jgi:uncharacterized protein (TIGR03435 family)
MAFHRETRELTVWALVVADGVGNRLGAIVVDKTGLKDAYDFTLTWAANKQQDDIAPALVTALREQLGLQLERQKAPIEMLVIDTLDRPSEN